MNLSKALNFILAAALLVVVITFYGKRKDQVNEHPVPDPVGKSAMDIMHERVSIRSYTDQSVSREHLELIVRAGMTAPSAMNKQPWQLVVVDDKEILHALGNNLNTSKMVQQAPAAIIVCGDLHKAGQGWLQEYWIQDCSAVSQNILLAITDMGLGGVWTSVYPAPERIAHVSGILDLPEHIVPLNIIPLGYPGENPEPKNKWIPENVKWNGWQD